jgi:hypothetical protein
MGELKIEPQNYRLALVLQTLFFPLTYPDLINSLRKRGFQIEGPLPSISGARSYLGGRIATKDGCTVDIDPDRKILANDGSNFEDVMKVHQELIAMAAEDFKVDLDKETDYLEMIASVIVRSGKSPLKEIQDFFKGFKGMEKFSEILGKDVTLYSLRITPKETLPSGKYWLDITIEPRVTMPESVYFVNVVYRNEDRSDVLRFSSKINTWILKLIQSIEGTS